MIKILIIDDEQLIQKSLTALFRYSSFDAVGTTNAHEGVEIGKRFCPDILIIDWMLSSDLGCLDVIDEMEKVSHNMKIIIMSGYPKLEIIANLKGKEVSAVCQKPVEFNALLSLIKKLISSDE